MIRKLSTTLILLAAAQVARAHFPFVVPAAGGATAELFLSEDLTPDAKVGPDVVAGATLSLRTADGKDTPLTATAAKQSRTLALPSADGVRVVHGSLDLGVMQRGEGKPYRLTYYPKTIVGDAFDARAALGPAAAPIEITPATDGKSMWLTVAVDGKPAPAGTEVHVIKPDAAQEQYDTDAAGRTEAFTAAGRYGAWTKTVLATPGKLGDKPYDEVRHYATLVFDNGAAPATQPTAAAAKPAPTTQVSENVRRLASMPEAVSSFGAIVSDGYLYVYGGHTADTHNYDTTAVSKRFHRLKLDAASAEWEELPGGPGVQGMNLAAYGGRVYRVGGMEPRNAPGTAADNYSLTQAAVFDPKANAWADLPAINEGRSSHDVIVVGHTLYVVGGWTMDGVKGGNDWPDTMLALDLSAATPAWAEIKQPFTRRALMTAAVGDKLVVIGGFTEEDKPSKRVDIYDTKAGTWSTGPELPGSVMNGFAPATATVGDKLYASVGDGSLLRLDGDHWTTVAHTTPRIVHRLAVVGNDLWVLGGAAKGKNLDLIEAVPLTPQQTAGVR